MIALMLRFGNGLETKVSLRDDTGTVSALLGAVPFRSVVHRWGDEVYFDAPFHSDREPDARADMEIGEVAFWPDGDAIAVFFGPTPASRTGKPRAYSPCNILGKIQASPAQLRSVEEGTTVEVVRPDPH